MGWISSNLSLPSPSNWRYRLLIFQFTQTATLHSEKWERKKNKLTYPSLDILKDLLPLEENTGSTNKLHWSLENCSSFVKAHRELGPREAQQIQAQCRTLTRQYLRSHILRFIYLKTQKDKKRKNTQRAGKIINGLNCVRLAT